MNIDNTLEYALFNYATSRVGEFFFVTHFEVESTKTIYDLSKHGFDDILTAQVYGAYSNQLDNFLHPILVRPYDFLSWQELEYCLFTTNEHGGIPLCKYPRWTLFNLLNWHNK